MLKRLISLFALIAAIALSASASYYPPVEIKLGNSGSCINISSSTSEGVTTYIIETTGTDPYISSANIGQTLPRAYNTITFEYNCTQGIDDPEIFFSPVYAGRELFYGPLAPTGPSEWKTATVYIANARTSFNWGNSASDYLRFDWGYKSGVTIQVRKLQIEADPNLYFEQDGLAFTKNPDGISVTVYGTSNSGPVVIPESVENFGNTYSVTKIGEEAFKDCSGLTSIEIPNSVTSIGEKAFNGCGGLTSVVWNTKNCADFTSADKAPFYGLTEITSFNFGNVVEKIPAHLCNGLSGMTSVTIPNSVTEIGECAFSGCSGLTSLIWNAKNCSSNGNMSTGGITSATIGNEVEILPEDFVRGSKITEITIPNSVTSIGSSAFKDCSGLTKVEISDLAAWCGISFGNDAANPLIYAHHLYLNGSEIKDLVIPNSVTSIGNYAFRSCSGLTSVTIPNSVSSIGKSVFAKCSGLTSVTWNAKECHYSTPIKYVSDLPFYDSPIKTFTFGNEVEAIPEGLCYGLSGLTSVTIGNSVTSIDKGAFYNCSGLTSVTIGNSVTSIGYQAFYNCSGLTNLIWNAKNCSSNGNMSTDGITSATIGNEVETLPDNFLNGSKITEIIIPNSVTSIGGGAFQNCSGLPSVEIPNSVTSIGKAAFSGCSGLTSVTIPNSVTSIGWYAFRDCSGLTSVTIGNSVTSIGDSAFKGCSGLTSVTIPNSVTSIGNSAFYNCSGLTSVNWNAKNCPDFASADNAPFNGLTEINTFNFGNEVERIPAYLCYGLSGITTISLGNAVNSIGTSAFEGCRGLTNLEFPSALNYIGQKSFYNCRGLLSITFPNSVTNIGEQAFANCTDLDNIYSYPNPANVTLGDDVFYEVPKFTCVLHVTPEHFDAYKKASQWKTFLNIIDDLAGVEGVEVDEATKEVEGYYNLQGIRINEPARGQVNIVHYKDGSSQKVVVK